MNGVPVKGKNKIKTIVLMMAMGVAMAAMADDFQTNPMPAHMCGNVAEEARFPAPLVLPKGTGFGFEPHGSAFSLLSRDVSVRVDGKEREVRSIRVSAHPLNRIWPGHQRPLEQTEPASYLAFEKNGLSKFEVRPAWGCTNVVVRPLSGGVRVTVRDGVASFVLPKAGYYTVEFDGHHRALHVFQDPVREFPERQKATRTFGPGVHIAGIVKVSSGDRIYIDKDAIVYGRFQGEGVRDVRIFGGGVVDGSVCERIFDGCYSRLQPHGIHFYESSDIVIDGPVFVNSACWCVAFFDCDNVDLSRIKIVGQWRYNTDGVDFCNCRNARVRDSFVRSFDDAISIKGIPPYSHKSVENISVERCVVWCDWGNACEPGVETHATIYRGIRFENCDIIHGSGIVLDVACGGPAKVRDVVYRDIRVELQGSTEPMVFQERDDQQYDAKGQKGAPVLIAVRNAPWCSLGGGGTARDISFQNVSVVAEEGAPMPVVSVALDRGNAGRVPAPDDIRIDGLSINGRPAVPGKGFIVQASQPVTIDGVVVGN